MSNKFYTNKLTDEVVDLMSNVKFSETSDRNATRGEILEEVISSLFERFLPNRCGIGSGHLLDSFDNISKQTDLVIHDRDSIPHITYRRSTKDIRTSKGFYPIEICWYGMEIKKTLWKKDLVSAYENLLSIENLRSYKMIPARVLFAYNTNVYKSISQMFEHYKKLDKKWMTSPTINVICVGGLGYMYFNDNEKKWKAYKGLNKYYEITYFICGVINSITGVNFDPYLHDSSLIEEITI